MQPISDKLFYKEMAKIKEKSKTAGGGILPPKKSASAYIIFQKEVSYSLYKSSLSSLIVWNPSSDDSFEFRLQFWLKKRTPFQPSLDKKYKEK